VRLKLNPRLHSTFESTTKLEIISKSIEKIINEKDTNIHKENISISSVCPRYLQ